MTITNKLSQVKVSTKNQAIKAEAIRYIEAQAKVVEAATAYLNFDYGLYLIDEKAGNYTDRSPATVELLRALAENYELKLKGRQ